LSAPIADEVLRELNARTKVFATVRGALAWYVAYVSAKMGRSASMESGGHPGSREKLDEGYATWSRIAKCLVMYDKDIDKDPPPLPQNWDICQRIWERRIQQLLTYFSSVSHQQRAADEGGFPDLASFSEVAERTMAKIGARLRARGVLGERR